ncbi:MAG: hypothetical protein PHV30_00365 [Candidatus Margulisbacteria bacterium]|nr:hypothetical protein [Candidatus Margulisiibacteriota bacterium]
MKIYDIPAMFGAKMESPKKYKLPMIITMPIQKETMLIIDSPSERLISMVPIPIAIKLRRPITTNIKAMD